MRPLRLQLKGFTSFREEQNVDFSSLDLFAIAGPTGAGKSSLLDAVTYALYGLVERVGGECGQLISQGLPSMAVTLEFDVAGERWRVTRRSYRKGATEVLLERFGEGKWAPEAGKVREVNDRVTALIGLDYDGFTRAVLLPQGKFDQFLAGDAKDRRRILTDLLDLHLYERMQKQALATAKQAKDRVDFLQKQLGTDFAGVDEAALSAERERILTLRDHEKRLVGVRKRVQQIVVRRNAVVGALDGLRGCATEAREHIGAASGVARALTRLAADISRAERDATIASKRAADATKAAETALAKLDVTRERFGTIKDLRELEKKADRFIVARDELVTLQATIKEADAAVATLRELLAAKKQVLSAARAVETRDRDARVAARKVYEKAQHDSALAAVAQGLRKGDRCPVCGSVLAVAPKIAPSASLERAKTALERAETASEASREAVAGAEEGLKDAEREQRSLTEQLAAARKASNERTKIVRESEDGLKQIFGARLPNDPGKALRDRIDEFEALDDALRAADSAASRAREAATTAHAQRTALLASLETEKARIPLAAATALVTRATSLAAAPLPAFAARPPVDGDAAAFATFATDLGQGLSHLAEAIDALVKERGVDERSFVDEAALVVGDLAPRAVTLDAFVDTLDTSVRKAAGDASAAEERAKRIERDLARKAELSSELVENEKRAQLMSTLAKDLQANAIVDFVQAEALRTLAAEGTTRLSYLSSERYRLRFRDEEFSVVDVWNGEEERSVRTLSGGETFLASLALALALSEQIRALATTERARLDSLFLDEGFGSLDADTLSTVVSGIERLGADNGRLIGVISHVRDLTDQFPRIEVEKTQRGSSAKLVVR
ncbi:MAG: SMC family ATPase [Chloroflexi bacterium]|nr:MAG: SMC family ATPase [Chloroflexota bacterium]